MLDGHESTGVAHFVHDGFNGQLSGVRGGYVTTVKTTVNTDGVQGIARVAHGGLVDRGAGGYVHYGRFGRAGAKVSSRGGTVGRHEV